MSDDDPFAEPDDTERTVIRPNPGGRRPSLSPQASAPPPQRSAPPPETPAAGQSTGLLDAGMTGPNRLNAAAATLFALIGRVRNRAQHPNPEELRRNVVAEIRAFENRALQAGVDMQQVRVARYAIAATIDDVVLNTPWAAESHWAQQSMVATFHRETVGGDRFYDLLARLEKDAANNIDLLEFLYVCLSLGFEGRLRVEERGRDRHAEIRMGLHRIIQNQRGEMQHELSPHWQGIDKPHRPLSAWKPVWIAVGALSLVLLCGFLALSYLLAVSTQGIAGQLAVLDPPGTATLERKAPPAVIPATVVDDTAQLEAVQGFLEDAIAAGLVTAFQDANTITVRLKGANMFASASDRLRDEFERPLAAVAQALGTTTGPVLIAGHSDGDPIRTARFPDNMALSLARAEAVKKRLEDLDVDPARLVAEGRAFTSPLVTPETGSDDKAQNRRVEIILPREGVRQ